ncbi:hypothetical protein [Lactiplantibacillus paraxiangfangensis]|uniref:hypothetical protein n=1 Tax=Lactiplantibacillus paraxiangfangensis TaxID=3076224 RepID=UPI0030C6A540
MICVTKFVQVISCNLPYLKVNTNDEKNQKFELTKISDGYKAKAINKTAKADDGLGSFELQKRK